MSDEKSLKDKVLYYIDKISKPDGRTSLAAQQILLSFALRPFSILISFLYVPLLIDYLDQERYGVWLTLISIVGWFSFLDVGLSNGLKNRVAQAVAVNDVKLAKTYVSTTYALLVLIFFSFLMLFHAVNPFVSWQGILNVNNIGNEELYLFTSVVFTFFALQFIVQTIGVIYQAMQKPFVGSLTQVLSGFLALLAVVFLTLSRADGNIVLLGAVVSAAPVISFVILTVISFSGRLSSFRPSIKSVDFSYAKEIINLGVNFFVIRISSVIIFSSSSFLIIRLFNPSEVVRFDIAFKYFSIPIMLNSIFLSPIWTSVTDAYTKGDFPWLRMTVKRLNKVSLLFVLMIVVMILLSDVFYSFWVGKQVEVPRDLSVLLGVFAIINVCLSPYSIFVNGFGKIKLSSRLSWVWMIVFVLITLSTAHFFNSSSSVALALCVTTFCGAFIQFIQAELLINRQAKGIWNE